MYSSSKALLAAFIFLIAGNAFAMQVQALYTSLCERQLGITLHTDKRSVYFLTTSGMLKKMPRYQVLSMASYPMDHFPVTESITIPKEVPFVKLWGHDHRGPILIAEGFVLGSNTAGFQVFTFHGGEVYISKESIWKVEIKNQERLMETKARPKPHYFVHPQQERCAEKRNLNEPIYASELITDPISIKRKFDQQIQAYHVLEEYQEAQAFYAVPQLYKNSTSIGYWLPLGNRYGSSEGRVAGLAPLIRNEYSQGPFSFQHLSLTGAGPVPDSIHEEPQTMLYYGFKASYLHFAAFFDPSVILAGSNYQWQQEDLKGIDDRVVESSYIALGFDRGPLSLTLFLNSHVFGGFQEEGRFSTYTADMLRVGLGWKTDKLSLKINTNASSNISAKPKTDQQWEGKSFQFARAEASYTFSEKFKAEAFCFLRKVSFDDVTSTASYQGSSQIFGLGSYYSLSRRWMLGTRVSMEKIQNSDAVTTRDDNFLKMSLLGSMNF